MTENHKRYKINVGLNPALDNTTYLICFATPIMYISYFYLFVYTNDRTN